MVWVAARTHRTWRNGERLRNGPLVLSVAVFFSLWGTVPASAVASSAPELADYSLEGFERTSLTTVSGEQWTTGFRANVAAPLTLVTAADVIGGVEAIYENDTGRGRVVITLANVGTEIRREDVDAARESLSSRTDRALPQASNVIAARVVVSTPGASDQPADAALVVSRNTLIRVVATGDAADGFAAVGAAAELEEQLRAAPGYQPVTPSDPSSELSNRLIGRWLVRGVLAVAAVAFLYLGPKGILTRRRADQNTVSNWTDPPT